MSSEYAIRLVPSIGTLYFKQYSKSISHTYSKEVWDKSERKDVPKGWTIDITIDFYIYVTFKQATDNDFTKHGGKIYIVTKFTGYVHALPDGDGGILRSFKYGLQDTSNLMRGIKELPNTGSGTLATKEDGVYTYAINYQQSMGMWKNNGNDSYDFEALNKETFTRISWKQSACMEGSYMGFEIARETISGVAPDKNPNCFGLQVFSADKFGKASIKITYGLAYGTDAAVETSETYELDLSANTMKDAK